MQRKALIQSSPALGLWLENEQRQLLVGSEGPRLGQLWFSPFALSAFLLDSTHPSWLSPSASQDSILSGL